MDTLLLIASFLDFADDIIQAIPDMFRMPHAQLQDMGITTRKMFVNSPKYGLTCPHPGSVTDAILLGDVKLPQDTIQYLAYNPNWKATDDRLKAAQYINVVVFDDLNGTGVDLDDLRALCRYDAIVRLHIGHPSSRAFTEISGYLHGRELIEMFMLIADNHFAVLQLAKTCPSIDELMYFLDDIRANGYDVALIIDNLEFTDDEYDMLRDEYD